MSVFIDNVARARLRAAARSGDIRRMVDAMAHHVIWMEVSVTDDWDSRIRKVRWLNGDRVCNWSARRRLIERGLITPESNEDYRRAMASP